MGYTGLVRDNSIAWLEGEVADVANGLGSFGHWSGGGTAF